MKANTLSKRILTIFGLPIALFLIWWLATSTTDSFYWPSPPEIFAVVQSTWLEGRIISDLVPSITRLLLGYLIALILGVGIGVALGSSKRMRRILEPVLEFIRAIPVVVLIPPLILFAGIGDTMKIVAIVIGCLFPILLNTVEGVRGIDDVLTDTAHTYHFGPRTRLLRLILPAASPQIITGARQSLSIAIIVMVISEMFAASNGIGFSLIQFQRGFLIPEMWSTIILLGILGVILALIFRSVEIKILAWHRGMRATQGVKQS